MKRIISIITVVALLFAIIVIPVSAQVKAKYDLKQAIEIAKEKLELNTEGYEFNSSYTENYSNNRAVWELYWYNNSGNGESISVVVDASTAEIISYNNWGEYSETTSKLPKYKRDEALKAAEEFVNKICPEKLQEVKLQENESDKVTLLYSDYYNFNYIREVNGLEFDANSINIGIDKNTLEVKFFYTTWDNEIFPSLESIISTEDAKNIFAEKQGLTLTYQLVYPNNGSDAPVAMLVYTLNNNAPIDAITGELITNSYNYPPYAYAEEKMTLDSGAVITEQEQNEINDTSKYISKDTAIEAIKVYIPEVENYALSTANLYSGYGTENANWYLSWNLTDEKTQNYSYISASVDAVTGEIKNFYNSDSNSNDTKAKEPTYTEEQGKDIATEFLKKIQAGKFELTEYQKDEYVPMPNDYVNPVYNYSFIRKENGVSCPFDTLNVGVNAFTGKIVSYNYWWVNVDLPSSENVVDVEKAYEAMYENGNLVLKYMKQYDYTKGVEKSQIKLAYVLSDFYGMIDANTGTVIGYDGLPYKENPGVTTFTDIQGHEAEDDINLLIESGIIQSETTEFNPDSDILQKDFIKMLVKAIEPYYNYPMYETMIDTSEADTGETDTSEYDYYYDMAIQKKIINERDKNKDGLVNKQEAAKMIVRALGYGYIAEKSNLFVSPFKDSSYISKAYRGYVVIAEEFGIFEAKDNKFNPKELLTNGDTATAIVKYLKVDTTLSE